MKYFFSTLIILFTSDAFSYGTGSTGYVVPVGTTVRINEQGVCKKVQNAHATYSYFLSAKTSPEWSSFVASPPGGVTLANCDATYRSCLDYKKANPAATTGKYTIDPDGVGVGYPAVDVYCDMTTDGGGWTLVWSNTRTGTNKPATDLNWVSTTTTTPLCSQAQGAGTGCATYLNNSKETFNYFIGLDWWNRITGHNKNSEMMYQWSSNYGSPIEQSAKFNFTRTNASKLYAMTVSNYLQMTGSIIPGNYNFHFGSRYPLSTTDVDNDLYSTSCANQFDSPFWYFSCWSGSINGGGENSVGYNNGAYYIGSAVAWGDPVAGTGAGNGWIFVREYEYLTNCTEIKYKYPNSPNGLYWIDPDGMGSNNPILAQCDMTTDGGGWTLLFNHKSDTGGFFANATEAESYNVATPNADRYSILAYTEGFRSLNGNFTFKINWPGYPKRNIWKQRTNPVVDQAVGGYIPVTIDSSTEAWGGLERNCTIECGNTLIDGSVGTGSWWYAIGTYVDYLTGGGHGVPSSLTVLATNIGVPQVQLWTRDDSFLLKTPRDCQDVLEYGQSVGSGLYWVDPLNSGSSMQVYCDMDSDGGGWTLVFNHNVAGGYFASAAEGLSKNPATPTANHYSILDQLDKFKANGRYVFKMNWPGYALRNIWMQTTNPTIDQPVAGYVPLAVDSVANAWGGIERNCAVGCTSAYIDGSVISSGWYYAIGSFVAWGTPAGIPASDTVAGATSYGVSQVQLWTRRSEGQFTKRSCKEILSAGLSTGDGQYFIDPDGVGGLLPFRVYCDMTTSGGGWTRVAYSKGATTGPTVPGTFFVAEYKKSLLGLTTVNDASSINTEWFSRVVGTTDAMLKAPAYPSSPYIDVGLGLWEYDSTRCVGTLRHTSRTAGCAGAGANDNWDTADRFNIAVEAGVQGIVPNYGTELCYSSKGSCDIEFYLR